MAELQSIIVFHSRHFVRHLGICISDMCQSSTTNVRCHCAQFSEKNEVSILINGWVTANYSVSRPSFCPPSWNLYFDLCKTLTGYVRCHFEQFKKTTSPSQTVFLRSTNAAHARTHAHTHAHTHTHDDSWRRNAMHCISPKIVKKRNVYWFLKWVKERQAIFC